MKTNEQRRKVCGSWYHQTWFRILLVIIGIDMIVLGFTFAIGVDLFSLALAWPMAVRIIGGFAYILVALFIVHYALGYRSLRKEVPMVCHHCAHNLSELKK